MIFSRNERHFLLLHHHHFVAIIVRNLFEQPPHFIVPSFTTMTNKQTLAQNNEIVTVLPGDNVTQYIPSSSPQNVSADRSTLTSSTSNTGRSTSSDSIPTDTSIVPKLGTGLRYDPTTQQIYATCAGRFICSIASGSHNQQNRRKNVYHVEPHRSSSSKRRYRPAREDRIVGIVIDRIGADHTDGGGGGDLYRMDINASHYGTLSNLQFEGATKRNKPILQPGQIVYARIMSCDDTYNLFDPILSCVNGPHDAGIPRKGWMTHEGCYGELQGGTVCHISMSLARNLLDPTCQNNVVLSELGKQKGLAFEIAIGTNGLLWLHSSLPDYTILIQNAIQNSDVLTAQQVRAMVKNLVYLVEKQLQQRRDS
jgi:exosome complex component RRP40